MKFAIISAGIVSALALGACTSSGNIERNAAGGAALGALAGAVIGNNTGSGDAGSGAAIGAIAGGVGGAAVGAQQDKNQQAQNNYPNQQYQTGPNGEAMIYDREYQRYFYVDRRSGRSFWANGEFRG
jgi:uncharacterized protein YcfJ